MYEDMSEESKRRIMGEFAEAISILRLARHGDPAAAQFADEFLDRIGIDENGPSFGR